LPGNPRLAAEVFALYPAQTPKARIARAAIRWAVAAHLPLGNEKVPLSFFPASPFVRFLADLAGSPPEKLPALGILAGNPNTPGRRFILLIFAAEGNPVAVVKAGLAGRAKELIERERVFLAAAPGKFPALPRLRAAFENRPLRALALDYFPGRSPRREDEAALPRLLSSWVNPESKVPVSQTRVWQELETQCAAHPIFGALAKKLRDRLVGRTLYHGDFAPWNIKVAPDGSWTALDWERGDWTGMPAWDWFHYVLQPAILVSRQSIPVLIAQLEKLCVSPEFRPYAQLSAIAGAERELAVAYLLHHNEVVQPSEGLPQSRELLAATAAAWLKAS